MKLLDSKWALVGLCAVVGLLGTTANATVVAKNVVVKVMERTGDKLFEKALEYPATLDTVPKIKATTPLIITFDSQTVNDTSLVLDQALVSFQHVDTKNEVALPARAVKSTESYKMDVSRKNFRLHFSSAPGVYNVALVLGSFKQGGLFYDLGNVEMVAPKGTKEKKHEVAYGPKPEIHHRFAEPQKMPNILVSLFFTGLVVVPFIGLLGGWAYLGVNADKLQMEPVGSVVFMGLIAAYITLAISYWIGVKLFPTLTYALVLALPTYLTGQYALSKRIEKRI
ncbi:proteasome regulatory particle base subunit [Coemansia sp. RSA 518]|nr:proteasome regulatory particle base subunit [Coemansia sp. RSA 788]KAJ2222354.1 proteasome regulatory particle base subunit [Coemansia sp. RSA 518]